MRNDSWGTAPSLGAVPHGRRVAVYYAWSRPAEHGASLGTIENRFPALFESRRLLYPAFAELSDPDAIDQGIAGFMDNILRRNFVAFSDQAASLRGQPVLEVERVTSTGRMIPLSGDLLTDVDTLIVISFDSTRTVQQTTESELEAIRAFLSEPGRLLFVAPHHDIGDDRETEFLHHGDRTIPPEQRFGGFARSLLAGLGVPVDNRFGLRPASNSDGSPAPLLPGPAEDRLRLLEGVTTFNSHPHLPHLARVGAGVGGLEVVARQRIDPNAPPHPFGRGGRAAFDALLVSRPGLYAGDVVIGDATLFSSTAGGVESLQRFWRNLLDRQRPVSIDRDSNVRGVRPLFRSDHLPLWAQCYLKRILTIFGAD